jgi:hypothetical protein
LGSLGVGLCYLRVAPEIRQTVVSTTLTLSQMSHVMVIHAGDETLFEAGLLPMSGFFGAGSTGSLPKPYKHVHGRYLPGR